MGNWFVCKVIFPSSFNIGLGVIHRFKASQHLLQYNIMYAWGREPESKYVSVIWLYRNCYNHLLLVYLWIFEFPSYTQSSVKMAFVCIIWWASFQHLTPVQLYKNNQGRRIGNNQHKHFLSSTHKQKSVLRFSTTALKGEKITVITCIYQWNARRVMSVRWYLTVEGDETPYRLPETVDYCTTHDNDLQYTGQCIHQCLFYTNSAWIRMIKSWYDSLQPNREADNLHLIDYATHPFKRWVLKTY